MTDSTKQPAAEDLVIVGAENISVAIYGETEGRREGNIRRIYHAISKGELPVFKLGGRVHARRSKIYEWIERMEAEGFQGDASDDA